MYSETWTRTAPKKEYFWKNKENLKTALLTADVFGTLKTRSNQQEDIPSDKTILLWLFLQPTSGGWSTDWDPAEMIHCLQVNTDSISGATTLPIVWRIHGTACQMTWWLHRPWTLSRTAWITFGETCPRSTRQPARTARLDPACHTCLRKSLKLFL